MEVGTVSNTKPNRRLRDFGGLCDTGIKVPTGDAKVIVSADKPFAISY